MRDKFIEIFNEHIKREGASKLLDYLKESDFFTAPSSTKFHSAKEGGLCEHSINVFERLKKLVIAEGFEERYNLETVAICGLLHDLCKVDYYKTEYRNTKIDGAWTQVPFYAIEDKLPYGHGEKSVYIVNGFLRLTREEAMAINWHMGGFDMRVRGGSYTMGEAYEKYPLSLLTHIADMQASYLDEGRS